MQVEISHALVRRMFDYDPAAGALIWRERPLSDFPDERVFRIWNARWAGFAASSRPDGYRRVTINYERFLAHRIIWLWVHGQMPEGDIDHINGDTSDNRLSNLRDVSDQANMRNAKRYHTNKSGVVGVRYDRSRRKWFAYIRAGKMRNLGRYDTVTEAVAARRKAEADLGFHPNHGRRA